MEHQGEPPVISLSAKQIQAMIQNAVAGALAAQSDRFAPVTQPSRKLPPPDRPSIDLDCNESRWAFFRN